MSTFDFMKEFSMFTAARRRQRWLSSVSLDVVTMGDNHEGLPELIDVYEGDERGRGYNSITAFDR